jgi:hypothetical protein
MASPRVPDIEIRSINHCIYCDNDSSAEKLTAEHVIPLSFGGHRILGAASCHACREETHAFEGQCCGTMFKALRVHQGVRTRRPKDRPTHLPVLAGETPHDAPIEQVPVDLAPGVAPFPILGPPQLMLGIPPTDRIDVQGIIVCASTDDAVVRQAKLVEAGRPGALSYSSIPLSAFLRTLAKIAHGYVVANVGLDGFKPLLVPLILGRTNILGWYVGGTGNIPMVIPRPEESQELHQIFPMTMTIRRVDYIAVQIRLFANLRPEQWHNPMPFTPVYLAIVGEYSGSKSDPHPVII